MHQDNNSAILLEINGNLSISKREKSHQGTVFLHQGNDQKGFN